MEEAVTALLLADARVRSLMGSRIHWGRLPQSAGTGAYAVLNLISGLPDYVSSGRSGLTQSRLQIDGYAPSVMLARDCTAAVVSVLEAYRGTVSGVQIQGARVAGARDFQPDGPPGKDTLYRRSVDLILWHSA